MLTAAKQIIATTRAATFAEFSGEVTAIGQKSLSADGPQCSVGDICSVGTSPRSLLAEVVSINANKVELLPLAAMQPVQLGDKVALTTGQTGLKVGDAFEGRAIDAFGDPIDGGTAIVAGQRAMKSSGAGMTKVIVPEQICTGIRAIDGLFPLAKGQRVGIIAASGAGKTTLIEQLSCNIECDKLVVCLIGERGREVERLWRLKTSHPGSTSATFVAATSDQSASARVRAMRQALAISEHWREQGEDVVLLVDSVTRLAMALREIGLVAGEPPALRSYTPNVFAALPEFVERCGAIKGKGSITAVFTVLSETDDVDDPIVETMKSLLDGHIVLSRKLVERGHFPAIDVGASISRVADQVLDPSALDRTRHFKKLFSTFEESRAMIESGLYQTGSNSDVDRATALKPSLDHFLIQSGHECVDLEACDRALRASLQGGGE